MGELVIGLVILISAFGLAYALCFDEEKGNAKECKFKRSKR